MEKGKNGERRELVGSLVFLGLFHAVFLYAFHTLSSYLDYLHYHSHNVCRIRIHSFDVSFVSLVLGPFSLVSCLFVPCLWYFFCLYVIRQACLSGPIKVHLKLRRLDNISLMHVTYTTPISLDYLRIFPKLFEAVSPVDCRRIDSPWRTDLLTKCRDRPLQHFKE